jgi:hypothetical protein
MAYVDSRAGDYISVLASAARTATPTVDTFHISGETQGLIVVIDVTAAVASPSVVFTIQGVDPVSAKTWDILASAAVTGTGTTVLRVHPEITASANLIAKDVVPAYFTVTAVHADADSITYSVAAQAV